MNDSRHTLPGDFGAASPAYAHLRPRYPEGLFDYLSALAPRRQLAWDCGCVQATDALAARFVAVRSSDVSSAQSMPRHNVSYAAKLAWESGLEPASVDLITVAQSLHWFELERFYDEAQRVMSPRAIFAAWSYAAMEFEDERVQALIKRYQNETLADFWPAQQQHVLSAYRDLPFPFEPILTPRFKLESNWHLPQLLAHLRSWSATARYAARFGFDPVLPLSESLTQLWGDPYQRKLIEWPLGLRIGRMRAA